MKTTTKKTIITIINIAIFIGNAIISQLGDGGDTATVATISSAVFSTVAML